MLKSLCFLFFVAGTAFAGNDSGVGRLMMITLPKPISALSKLYHIPKLATPKVPRVRLHR